MASRPEKERKLCSPGKEGSSTELEDLSFEKRDAGHEGEKTSPEKSDQGFESDEHDEHKDVDPVVAEANLLRAQFRSVTRCHIAFWVQ